MTIKVLIADDHSIVREGIRLVLEKEKDIQVAGEAVDGQSAVNAAGRLRPDVVVMDVFMPGIDGAEATRKIKAGNPDCKVIAMSGSEDVIAIRNMLEAGADGYILKSGPSGEVADAIRETAGGGRYFSREVLNSVVLDYTGKKPVNGTELTDKEKKIVGSIADGKNTKEIASDLDLSVKSIEVYRSQIMEKLGIRSVADLVKYAIRNGLSKL